MVLCEKCSCEIGKDVVEIAVQVEEAERKKLVDSGTQTVEKVTLALTEIVSNFFYLFMMMIGIVD